MECPPGTPCSLQPDCHDSAVHRARQRSPFRSTGRGQERAGRGDISHSEPPVAVPVISTEINETINREKTCGACLLTGFFESHGFRGMKVTIL
ncbi:MAG: hypothetical protein OXC57_14345 [Rhodobacteraceae bacterium]|nr:hypothetical protein [Paracoccaceae bacterium]